MTEVQKYRDRKVTVMNHHQTCYHASCSEYAEKNCTICRKPFCGFHLKSKGGYDGFDIGHYEQNLCDQCSVSNNNHQLLTIIFMGILALILTAAGCPPIRQ